MNSSHSLYSTETYNRRLSATRLYSFVIRFRQTSDTGDYSLTRTYNRRRDNLPIAIIGVAQYSDTACRPTRRFCYTVIAL